MRLKFSKLFLAFSLVLVAGAASAASRAPEPALWRVSAGESTVYLFGSIHMLPRDWAWRTKAIDAAIRSSDVFVFETALTPNEMAKMRLFVRDNGTLPRGESLSKKLSPQGLKDFNKALTLTPLDPASVNTMRPWLALMVLGDYQIQNGPLRSFAEEGVDFTIEEEAREAGKPVRHLETAESQFEILMKTTPDDDIAGFEAELHDLLSVDHKFRRLLEGWTVGSQTALAKVLTQEAARNPDEKKLLLDTRNRNWVPQIESMMMSKQTIFVTAGAAHFVGPGSVLDILCLRGWKVQREKTGPSVPPPACRALKSAPSAALRTSQVALRP